MSSTWLSIRVDLVEGHCDELWPRPGRIFAAARTHTFVQLAGAIDDAFARWDRSHLHQFHLAGGHRVGEPDPEWDDADHPVLDGRRLTLGRLKASEQFVYEFDFGDSWLHLCTVAPRRIDPAEQLGVVPNRPLPYWGWGSMPDQYGRSWDGDDGESPKPKNPKGSDLPSIGPWQLRRGHLAMALLVRRYQRTDHEQVRRLHNVALEAADGILACTSSPARYQPSKVRTAKVCLKSCSLGGEGASAPMPAVSMSCRKVCCTTA